MCRNKISDLPENMIHVGLVARVGQLGYKFQWLGVLNDKNVSTVSEKTIQAVDKGIKKQEGANHHSIHLEGNKWTIANIISQLNIEHNLPGINNSNPFFTPLAEAA